jgi:GAF domain-containing protein
VRIAAGHSLASSDGDILEDIDSAVSAGQVVALPGEWYTRHAVELQADVDEYMHAIDQAAVFPLERIDATARLLHHLANSVSRLPSQVLSKAKITKEISDEAFRPVEAGRSILRELGELIPFQSASLQIIHDGRRRLLAASGCEGKPQDPYLLRPIAEDKLVSRIMRDCEPIILSDPAQDSDWCVETAPSVRSWIGSPIIYADEVIGLITLDHDQVGYYQLPMKEEIKEFCRSVAPLVWNAQLWDRADRLDRDKEIFEEVLQVISAKLDIKALLQTIATQIAERLHCSHCTIFLAQQEGEKLLLVPQVTHGISDETMTRSFSSNEGLAGWVFEKGESVIISDAANDGRFAPPRLQGDAPRSMLVVPVKVGEKTIGIISADQDALAFFSRSDLRLVDALAQHAGIAIQRSTALTLLHDIGTQIIGENSVSDILHMVISGAIRLTNTAIGVIYLVAEDGQTVTDHFSVPNFGHPKPRMNNPSGLTCTAVRTGQLLIIDNTREPHGDLDINPELREAYASVIVVPLKIQDKVIGVFFLDYKNKHDFTEMEVTLLNTLASQAAIAIQKARLITNLQRDVSSRRVFEDVLRNLAVQEPDQDKTLDSIVKGVQEILDQATYLGSPDQVQLVSTSINLYDHQTNKFGRCHLSGPLTELLNSPPRSELEGGTGMWVVKSGQPLYLEDVNNSPKGIPTVRQTAIDQGIKSFAAIPLTRHTQILGVLFIDSQKTLTFDDQSRRLLELFALQASVAIEIARFHESVPLQNALVQTGDLGFIAGGIAHEFRNRLQIMDAIVVRVERLQVPNDIRDQLTILTMKLRSEMGRASKTIDFYQDLSRQVDRAETFDINNLIAQIVQVGQQRARDHRINLSYQSCGVEKVKMNSNYVSSILMNLLNNAIEATRRTTRERREVEVGLKRDPDSITIEVKDSGPGVPPEMQANIFLPFYTSKGAGGGFGLGLFWVKTIVSRMKGTISFEPSNDWLGATFTVVLPCPP